MLNRREMMRLVLQALAPHLPPFKVDGEAINCHHNYVAQETHFGDEIPGAYKDIDEVMANQEDLAQIVHTLKQVVCVKG